METVEFNIYEDFCEGLAERFTKFINSLSKPCIIAIDIESYGGFCHVLEEMEVLVKQKKAEGYVFATNVDTFAYSCGLFFFLLGDLRYCADEANFLYHSAGYWIEQRVTSHDAREMLEELLKADEVGKRIVSENTTVTPEILNILDKNENYLSREDLVYLGFMENEYELI